MPGVRPDGCVTRFPRGLYLLTPDRADTAALLAATVPLLPHVAMLQYRNKSAGASLAREQAVALASACRHARVPFIVNDDVALAAAVGAAGVHLGEHDDAIGAARGRLGPGAIIGASCYDDADRARRAAAAGADYLAFGAFHPSATKPAARRASPGLLRAAAELGRPLVAIGGITPDNAAALVAAGADLVAVVSGVYDAPDPVAAARAYAACFA